MNSISLTASPSAPPKDRRTELKQALNKAKTYGNASKIFGIDCAEAEKTSLADLLPRWMARRRVILGLGEEAAGGDA